MNQVTHWLDASQVYGSTSSMVSTLRSFKGGHLNTGEEGVQKGSKLGMLPRCGKANAKNPKVAICSSG